MNFQDALTLMQEGKIVTRKAWGDPNVFAMLDEVCGARTDFQKQVACRVAHYTHAKLGWHPHPNDILAEDWELVK
jgi:precorrin-3B methylase